MRDGAQRAADGAMAAPTSGSHTRRGRGGGVRHRRRRRARRHRQPRPRRALAAERDALHSRTRWRRPSQRRGRRRCARCDGRASSSPNRVATRTCRPTASARGGASSTRLSARARCSTVASQGDSWSTGSSSRSRRRGRWPTTRCSSRLPTPCWRRPSPPPSHATRRPAAGRARLRGRRVERVECAARRRGRARRKAARGGRRAAGGGARPADRRRRAVGAAPQLRGRDGTGARLRAQQCHRLLRRVGGAASARRRGLSSQ